MFDGVDIDTLRGWLREAQEAYQALMTGAQIRSLSHGLKRMDYQRADASRLLAYIRQLQTAVDAGGSVRPSAVGIIF